MRPTTSSSLHRRNLVSRLYGFWKEDRNYPRFVMVDEANQETVSYIRETGSRFVAEIGIYEGHTSVEIAKVLNGVGELHIFDFQDRVDAVGRKISAAGYHNVKGFGSSYKLLDSYNWQLAKLIEINNEPIYDYVYIDGAHTFAIDGLTFFLADRLLKTGGYMDFDDYEWTLAGSPSMRPERFPLTRKLFTREQIDAQQVKMVVDLLVRKSGRYSPIVSNKIFKKLA